MKTTSLPVKGRSFQDQASKRVSFVLTTRDRAEFVRKALASARDLVKPEDELIVIDGSSTGETAQVVSEYSDLVDRFVSESDLSPEHAINKGMLLSSGRYIKHLTDDDAFFSRPMEQAIQLLEDHPEVDILVCGGTRQLGNKCYPFYIPPGANYGSEPEDVFRYGICGCGILIRRSALSRTGLYDFAALASDGEYIARAIHHKANVKFCRVNLFHHPIYDHSRIIDRKRDYGRETDRIVKLYCSRAFYLKFRAKSVISRRPWLRWPALAVRSVLRTILATLGSKRARVKNSPQEPVWDGGFS